MATRGERIATIEAGVSELRKAVAEMHDLYHGGPSVEYDHSVRGRLHHLETTLSSFVLRRSFGVGMLKAWQGSIIVLCGVITAACAVIAALAALGAL